MAHIYNSQLDAFDLYHQVHDSYYSRPSTSVLGGPALPALGHALAGSTGAAISSISTYPLSLVITRLQIQRQLQNCKSQEPSADYTSIQTAVKSIYTQEGVQGLYTGLIPDTVKTIADAFLFFLAYNFLRQSRTRKYGDRSSRLPVLDELGVGFLAGAFSKFLTTPLANVVTRKQASSALTKRFTQKSVDDSSFRSIAQEIRCEKGIRGFWSGYSASLVLTLNPSLTFFFFEKLKRALVSQSQQGNTSPQATFLLAAISKALASVITYPFSLAKSRAQFSSPSVTTEPGTNHQDLLKGSSSTGQSKIEISENVFATILYIIRHEGLRALYDGVSGEVLKGFFSHGITIFIKDIVHKAVIQLYYILLRLLKMYPNPQSLRQKAGSNTSSVLNMAVDHTKAATAAAKEQLFRPVVDGRAVVNRHHPSNGSNTNK
ncbi:MAG: hypothetical protein Q9195_004204 [Heterodermia aff. obscurata]